MHKENDKTKTQTIKSKKSQALDLDQSPVRTNDLNNVESININSTPSNPLITKPNFSFSSYSSPSVSFETDSAYYSQTNMSNLSMDLNKSILNNFASYNSPLNMHSTNISFNLSPFHQYYYNHTSFLNNFNTSIKQQQHLTITSNNSRTIKSVFKPYE